jgi:hypothetical protein
MEKILLHSDEEYFAYCEQNQIGYISRQQGSQSCFIENGVRCRKGVTLYKGTDYEAQLTIDNKPSHYPCILVYEPFILTYIGVEDVIRGMFIYSENFED